MNSQIKLWSWLGDPENRSRLAFIGTGMAAVAVAVWQLYLHFAPPVAQLVQPPAVSAPVDQDAIKRLGDSQARALGAEACALDNVTRQISGEPPIACPAPGSNR
jgi:hypothetical protein